MASLSSGGTTVDVAPKVVTPTPSPAESDDLDVGTLIILVAVILLGAMGGVVVCAVLCCLRGRSNNSDEGMSTTKNPLSEMDITDEPLEME